MPSCGLRVFYTGTIFCAPPTSTYSGAADPAQRPSMEEVRDALHEMYSAEVRRIA